MIAAGLRIITRLVGPSAFGGKGESGPVHVMTDDCEAEGAIIRQVWSSANRLLCTFHLGQAAWRWLRQTSSSVAEGKRQQRMKEFRSLVFSSTRESLDRRYL